MCRKGAAKSSKNVRRRPKGAAKRKGESAGGGFPPPAPPRFCGPMPLRGIPLRGNPAAPALPPPHIPGPRRTGAVRVPGEGAGDAKGGEKGKSPLSLFPRPPLLPRGGRRRPGRPLRHFLPGDKGPAGTRAAPAGLFPRAHLPAFLPRAAPAGLFARAAPALFPSAAPRTLFPPCRTAHPFPPCGTCRPFFPCRTAHPFPPCRTCREGPGAGGAGPARPHTPKPPACRAGAPAGLPPKKCGEAPLRARGGEPLFVAVCIGYSFFASARPSSSSSRKKRAMWKPSAAAWCSSSATGISTLSPRLTQRPQVMMGGR